MAIQPIQILIEAKPTGEEAVQKLAKTLDVLGSTLEGDVSTGAKHAAESLRTLAQSNEVAQAFAAVKREAADLHTALDKASTTVEGVALKMPEAAAATQKFAAAEDAAKKSVQTAQHDLDAMRASLTALKQGNDAAARGTDDYKAAVSQARLAIADLSKSLAQKKTDLREAQTAASAAKDAERTLDDEYARSIDAAKKVSAAYGEKMRALEAARTAAQALGIDTSNLRQAEQALAKGIEEARVKVQALQEAQVRAAAASRSSAEASREQAESDRLLAIQKKAAEDQAAKARNALLAEIAAQRDAEAVTRKVMAARAADAAAQLAASEAASKAAQARREQAESDRLAIIQLNGLARARQAGLAALEAERAAQRDAAKAVDAYNARIAAAAAEQKRLADAAAAAAQALKNAYSTVGVRSAQELQAEIARVRAAMETIRTSGTATGSALQGAFSSGNAKIKELELDLRRLEGTLTTADKTRAMFSTGMGQITGGNLAANAIRFLVSKVSEIGPAFWKANTELETTRRALDAIYKNSTTAASQLDFLRKTADQAGVSASSLSSSFVSFSAATKTAGIPLETTNALFGNITKASATLGLSTEKVSLVLQALGQMASKGTVAMEELRGQLGESLPGALSMAAQGLGLTELQLINLVSSGKLAARDLFPALAESLKTMASETVTAAGTWERFKNALDMSLTNVGDSGGMSLLTLSLRSLAAVLAAIVLPLAVFVEAVFGVSKAVGVLVAALFTLSNPLDALKEIFSSAGGRLDKLDKAFQSAAGMSDDFAESQDKAATATRASEQAVMKATWNMANATTAVQANAAATDGATLAQQIMGDKTADLGKKWTQLSVKLGEVVTAQEKQVAVSEKLAAAAKIEGDSIVALTKLRGNDADTLQAEIAAAEKNIEALGVLDSARKQGLATLQAELTQKLALVAGNEKESTARAKEITDIRSKVTAMEAESIASHNALEAAKNEATARRIALDAYKDNALAVTSSRVAMEKAMEVEATYIALEKEGKISKDAVTYATRQRTEAEALYKDALSDSIKLESARASAQQSQLQLQQTGYTLLLAQTEAAKQKAVRDGNEYAFAQAVIKQKEIEIKLIELRYTTLMTEAAGIMAVSNATRAELEAKGTLTEVQRLSIENSIRSAEIKLTEAEATKAGVTELKKQLEALRTGTDAQKDWNAAKGNGSAASDAHTSALGRETGATYANTEAIKAQEDAFDRMMMKYTQSSAYTERQIALLEREAAAAQKVIDTENKRLNRDSEGFSIDPTTGQRVSVDVQSRRTVYDNAKSQGLTEAQALQIASKFMTENGTQVGWNSGGVQGAMNGQTWSSELQKAIDAVVLSNARVTANAAASATANTATSATAQTQAASTYITNVTIDGGQKTISMTDASSSANLNDILRQLAAARNTAA